MAGKPLNEKYYPRYNSGPRVRFKQGPKSWRRRFLGEMGRTNNVFAALKFARINWDVYTDWLDTGFLSEQDLKRAEDRFYAHHPRVDIVVTQSTVVPLEDGSTVVDKVAVEAVGYDVSKVLREDEGWISTEDWQDDDW
jgi:hypothetical protein